MTQILVIEDEVEIAEAVQVLLESQGDRVQTAANGQNALDRMKTFLPQMMILDFMMPVMNGSDFLSELKKTNHRPVLIAMSENRGIIPDWAGPTFYLPKPFTAERLFSVVNQARSAQEQISSGI